MPFNITIQDLIGPGCAIIILLVGCFLMGKWLVKLVESKIADLKTDLTDCHKRHEDLEIKFTLMAKDNSILMGKVDVLERLKTSDTFASEVAKELYKLLIENGFFKQP